MIRSSTLQVILDVVYNHTNEADDKNPYTTSFRGIDNKVLTSIERKGDYGIHTGVLEEKNISSVSSFYTLSCIYGDNINFNIVIYHHCLKRVGFCYLVNIELHRGIV